MSPGVPLSAAPLLRENLGPDECVPRRTPPFFLHLRDAAAKTCLSDQGPYQAGFQLWVPWHSQSMAMAWMLQFVVLAASMNDPSGSGKCLEDPLCRK